MVYVIQEQPGKNIIPAMQFGRIKILLPERSNVAFSAGALSERLMVSLSKFNDSDYLLLIGDPVAIGIATAAAASWNNGRVKLLKWDRMERVYIPVAFNLYQKENENETDENKLGR